MQFYSFRHTLTSNTDIKIIAVSCSLLIFAIGWIVAIYSDVAHHEFLNWDDTTYIINNPYLREISSANLYWMFTDVSTINWHPLTWLTYNIELYLFGENASLFKLTNVAIHVINCAILYFLFKKILYIYEERHNNSKTNHLVIHYSALLAASLFAIHPQHIESVVWVSETKDVLCALFYILTLLNYIKYRSENNRRYYYLAVIFALFATMAKPMSVSLPAILLIFDMLLFQDIKYYSSLSINFRHSLKDKIPFIIFAAFIAAITLYTQNLAIKDFDSVSLISRIINANIAALHYLGTIILPAKLSPFYPYSDIALNPSFFSILPIITNFAILLIAIKLWKMQQPLYLLALIFFFVTIVPVIGLITVGHQAYADRYSYLPTSIFYLALAQSFMKFFYSKSTTKTFRAAISLLLVTFVSLIGITSTQQVKAWANDESLWSTVIKRFPNEIYIAHQNLGNVYLVKGLYSKAIKQYNIALQIKPKSAKTHENMGRAYANIGDSENEIKQYLIAIKIDSSSPWPYLFAGNYYLQNNEQELASKYLGKAFEINPYSSSISIANAKLNLLNNDTVSAKTKLVNLLKYQPNNLQAMKLLVHIYQIEGDTKQSTYLQEKMAHLANGHANSKVLSSTNILDYKDIRE